jgi:hypothetical protein
MSDFKDKLNGLLAKDNGFMIDFFSDSTLSEEDESIVRKHLADYLLESINKLDAG